MCLREVWNVSASTLSAALNSVQKYSAAADGEGKLIVTDEKSDVRSLWEK